MTDHPPGGLLRAIVGTLEAIGIPYMVVGSFASTAYGEPRSTRDLDLVIDPSPEHIRASRSRCPRRLRAKQGGSDRQLEDVAGILRVRGPELDVVYIERWVAELGLAEQWRRARTSI
jgi:hypothetical protein